MNNKISKQLRKGQECFTLIELGVAIAVICVLSTGIMVGKGLLDSSRVTTAANGIAALKKALVANAMYNGGSLQGQNMDELADRNFIPPLVNGALQLSGERFTVSAMGVRPDDEIVAASPHQLTLTVNVPDADTATRLRQFMASSDPNYSATDAACTDAFADGSITICLQDLV